MNYMHDLKQAIKILIDDSHPDNPIEVSNGRNISRRGAERIAFIAE